EPQMAPKAAQAPTVALASAPRKPENTALAAPNSSRDICAREATAPIRLKSGTTESEQALGSSNGTEATTARALCQPSIAAQPPAPTSASDTAIGMPAHLRPSHASSA